MKNIFSVSVALSVLLLGGCDLRSPTYITQEKVQISKQAVMHNMLVSDADDAFIAELSRHYTKHSGSVMEVAVTYDPKSRSNTAMHASNNVANIVESLRDYGVTNVNIGILPVKSQGSNSHLLVSYSAFNAHAPKGCDVEMPGMNGSLNGDNSDYKLGCATKTMLARQIAKPSHLLGRGATGETTDGRSATNIVDIYRSGQQNEPLEGEQASSD